MERIVKIEELIISETDPVICVPAVGTTKQELFDELNILKDYPAQIIEWRADFFEGEILAQLKEVREQIGDKKLLFTFRTKKQGGEKDCENYFELLKEVIESKLVHMVDIEFCFGEKIIDLVRLAKKEKVVSVLSDHYFEYTPSRFELCAEYKQMTYAGADIPKIAVMPNSFRDVYNFMRTVSLASKTTTPIIGISMGKMGAVTRLCSKDMGSCLSFAAGVKPSAPGQLESRMVQEFFNS